MSITFLDWRYTKRPYNLKDYVHTIELPEHPILGNELLEISGYLLFTYKGGYPSNGWDDPGCGPEVDIWDFIGEDGRVIFLTEEQYDAAYDSICENYEYDYGDPRD